MLFCKIIFLNGLFFSIISIGDGMRKLNKRGWGMDTMIGFLIGFVVFLLIILVLIYNLGVL